MILSRPSSCQARSLARRGLAVESQKVVDMDDHSPDPFIRLTAAGSRSREGRGTAGRASLPRCIRHRHGWLRDGHRYRAPGPLHRHGDRQRPQAVGGGEAGSARGRAATPRGGSLGSLRKQ